MQPTCRVGSFFFCLKGRRGSVNDNSPTDPLRAMIPFDTKRCIRWLCAIVDEVLLEVSMLEVSQNGLKSGLPVALVSLRLDGDLPGDHPASPAKAL